MQCKLYVTSCRHATNSSFALCKFLELFSKYFHPWLNEFMDAGPEDLNSSKNTYLI